MEATPVASTPWQKTCSRCKKPTFEDLLDEQGLCDYCKEIASMRASSGGKQAKNRPM